MAVEPTKSRSNSVCSETRSEATTLTNMLMPKLKKTKKSKKAMTMGKADPGSIEKFAEAEAVIHSMKWQIDELRQQASVIVELEMQRETLARIFATGMHCALPFYPLVLDSTSTAERGSRPR